MEAPSIGTHFKTRGKHPRDCVVIDIYETRNSHGGIVRTTYLCEHETCGKKIRSEEVATTILMGQRM